MTPAGNRLSGKIAIITGAGNGIGAGCALRFAEEGATVVVAEIDETAGRRTVQAIEAAGGAARFQQTDITRPDDVRAMIEDTVASYGKLDILWNNAGGAVPGTDAGETMLERLTVEEWDQTHALSLRSVFLGLKYAVPHMRRNGGGVVLCTASVAGLRGGANLDHYNVQKAGVIRLVQGYSQTIGRDNIRLNAIAPGFTLTDASRAYRPAGTDESIFEIAQPLPRVGLPRDIANCGLFLASEEGSFITGLTIPVDGGWWANAPMDERYVLAAAAAQKAN